MGQAICKIVKSDRDVQALARPMTMYFGPEDVLLNIAIQFKEGTSGVDLVRVIDPLESKVREAFPVIRQIYRSGII